MQSSFTPNEEAEIREALGWYRFHKATLVGSAVVGILAIICILVYTFPPEGPPPFAPIVYEKASGDRIENRKDGTVIVTTPKGQVRMATTEEQAEYSAWKKERYLDR